MLVGEKRLGVHHLNTVAIEEVIQLLSKCLRIIQKLKSRKVWCRSLGVAFFFSFLGPMAIRIQVSKYSDTYFFNRVQRFRQLFLRTTCLLIDLMSMFQPFHIRNLLI